MAEYAVGWILNVERGWIKAIDNQVCIKYVSSELKYLENSIFTAIKQMGVCWKYLRL